MGKSQPLNTLQNPVASQWDVLIVTVILVLMAPIYWGVRSAKWFLYLPFLI